MILGLFGSLLQCGGIERANRLIGAVLTEMAREQGQTCELLSLNEPSGPLSSVMGGRQCSGTGFGLEPPRPATPGRILTAGRLAACEPENGVDTVIRALPQVLRAVPQASYVVVDDGDDRRRLQRLAEQTGVYQHVHFVGHQREEAL